MSSSLAEDSAGFTLQKSLITPGHIETKSGKYGFKYLVVSPGIAYPIFIENRKNTYTLKNGEEAKQIHDALQKAKNIVIVGGGLIGTEIAGELVTKTKSKQITMIEPGERILSRNPPGASAWAARFLTKRGCKIIYGERPRSGPLVISLGDWAGLFTFKNFWWGGVIPALMKKMIEIWVMLRTKYYSCL